MKLHHLLLIISIVLHLASCNEKQNDPTTNSLDGIYQQIGYGSIVKIEDGQFEIYDETAISCLSVFKESLSVFGDNLAIVNDTLKLQDGINEYRYIRLANAPELCGQKLSDAKKSDPVYNFEVLAANFEQHYAYFELRKVNWDSLYTTTKKKITPQTNDAELYNIFEDMLNSFGDGHIGLEASSEIEEAAAGLRENQDEEEENKTEVTYGDFQIAQMVSDHYLKDKIKSSRSNLIRWGYIEKDIAYLQINLMMGHGDLSLADSLQGIPYLRAYFNALEDFETSEQHTRLEVAGIRATLKTAMSELSDSKALLLDIRFNGGGKDEVAMEIMRHFNATRRLVFTKQARLNDGFTPVNNVMLDASEQPYIKPVFILTSRESASATEIMTLSSLLLEHIVRIGNHTEGVFSDVMEKALPNGWEVGMSNEVYLDTKGTNYESVGITPTVSLNYHDGTQDFFRSLAADLEADKQKILMKVREMID